MVGDIYADAGVGGKKSTIVCVPLVLLISTMMVREIYKSELGVLQHSIGKQDKDARGRDSMSKVGGLGVHEVGGYLLLYTFILNTSGIGN